MSRRREAAVARLAFPVVISAAIAWAIYLIEAGASPLLAFVLAQVPAYLLVTDAPLLAAHHLPVNPFYSGRDFLDHAGRGQRIADKGVGRRGAEQIEGETGERPLFQ